MRKALIIALSIGLLTGCTKQVDTSEQMNSDSLMTYMTIDDEQVQYESHQMENESTGAHSEDSGASQIILDEMIQIESENFIADMDKIIERLDEYEGKQLTYEGFIVQTDKADGTYAVVRNYELDHGNHAHTIHVGMDATYDGEWPKVDSWVKVTGVIERNNSGAGDYPVLHIEQMQVMPERGQETVYQ